MKIPPLDVPAYRRDADGDARHCTFVLVNPEFDCVQFCPLLLERKNPPVVPAYRYAPSVISVLTLVDVSPVLETDHVEPLLEDR
jgi:hypothetical protein